VARCALDLRGRTVLTEAATGPYVVTPILAALAGAEVIAVTKDTPYGSVADVVAQTRTLAERLGVSDRIMITPERDRDDFARADVITNSGHLRPIVGEFAAAIRPGAALALMFESWEIQAGRVDLDLALLRRNGVLIAGTNERHPNVGVFDYLGLMAVLQLADAGVPTLGSRIALLCDNPFLAYIVAGLENAGAVVSAAQDFDALDDSPCDALIVALTPTGTSVLTPEAFARHAARNPGAPVVQYWGDLDRLAAAQAGVGVWPVSPPHAGHMAVLPSRPGPDAIVRLQCGGLKVGQVLLTPPESRAQGDNDYMDEYPGVLS
jgi:hypothetical protein